MARYKIIDRNPRFLPVVLDAQLMSGSAQKHADFGGRVPVGGVPLISTVPQTKSKPMLTSSLFEQMGTVLKVVRLGA